MEEEASTKKKKPKPKPSPGVPAVKHPPKKHPKPKPKPHPKPHPHPHPKPKPHPKPAHKNHSGHRAPSWLKIHPPGNRHKGWLAEALLATAAAAEQEGFAGLTLVSESSNIITGVFAEWEVDEEEGGPELSPVEAATYVAEGMVCMLLLVAIYICVLLLVVALLLHKIAIGVGPFKARIGAVFDPLVGLMEGAVKHCADGIEEVAHDVTVVVAWLFAIVANAIGLLPKSAFQHFWNTRFMPLFNEVRNLRNDIRGINWVLFHGIHGLVNRVGNLEKLVRELEAKAGKLPNLVGFATQAEVHHLQGELNAVHLHFETIAGNIHDLEKQVETWANPIHGLQAQLNHDWRAIMNLWAHVGAIERAIANFNPQMIQHLQREITVIQQELNKISGNPLVGIEQEITSLEREVNWIVSLHPGQIWNAIHDIDGSIKWLESLNPGKVWPEIHDLEAEIANIAHAPIAALETAISTLNREVHWLISLDPGKIAGEIANIDTEIAKLEGLPIHALQAELNDVLDAVKWLESLHPGQIAHEFEVIQQEINKLEHLPSPAGGLTAKQLAMLNTAFHVASVLAPLVALAPLTAARLANLKALEDDPCQCLDIGGLSAPLIGAVVADLMMKDGV